MEHEKNVSLDWVCYALETNNPQISKAKQNKMYFSLTHVWCRSAEGLPRVTWNLMLTEVSHQYCSKMAMNLLGSDTYHHYSASFRQNQSHTSG
jgi:hypothetical protein